MHPQNKHRSMKGLFKFLIWRCIHDCLQDVGLSVVEGEEEGKKGKGEEEKFEKHCLG